MTQGVRGVLFDLGNTLAAYYGRGEFEPILKQSLRNVLDELRRRDAAQVEFETAFARSQFENREAGDYRVRPLAERLVRIFELEAIAEMELIDILIERFLEPIFAVGRVYDDAHEALEQLRGAGHHLGIVSNAPWGSPSALWKRELARLGLLKAVDLVVFCGDVGWRKPAHVIFDHAARELGLAPAQCVFVGDDIEWDMVGGRNAGMRTILVDRMSQHGNYAGERAGSLTEIANLLA